MRNTSISGVLWAKTDPYHPLWCHLLDTAAVCEQLIECFGLPDELPRIWTMYLAGVHDIGKADPEFQSKNKDFACVLTANRLKTPRQLTDFRHEARSSQWIYYRLFDKYTWEGRAAEAASEAILAHHGNFAVRSVGNDSLEFKCWEEIRNELGQLVEEVLGIECSAYAPERFSNTSATGIKLTGLIVLSDWIASNLELFDYASIDERCAPIDYWQAAQSKAEGAISLLKFKKDPKITQSRQNPDFRVVWPAITNLYPSQTTLEKACQNTLPIGLTIIEAPMGEGKTESAIYLAECRKQQADINGAYIALPTMATSNQMHTRYREFLSHRYPNENGPKLIHGMSWIVDEIQPDDDSNVFSEDSEADKALIRDWFAPSKRALLAPESVGTIDQVLLAAMNVKHGFLRLLGLSKKVLIIDEVHAYDEYMTTILERLLQWCSSLSIPVIMLSATLSRAQKARLIRAYNNSINVDVDKHNHYPLIMNIPLQGENISCYPVPVLDTRVIHIKKHYSILDNTAQTAELAVESVENGGCVCVLMNTVTQAQSVYRKLTELTTDIELHLFHARFPAGRRNIIEDQIVKLFGKDGIKNGKRPKRAILVATQVVEQSLDLDFDVIITQIAPIDLLLQRAGRLRRHKTLLPDANRPTPEVFHILLPDKESLEFGSTGYVYFSYILYNTMQLVKNKDKFELPKDFRPLVDNCYGDDLKGSEVLESKLSEIRNQWQVKRDKDQNFASSNLIPKPDNSSFVLGQLTHPKDEASEGIANNFTISTRTDNHSKPVILITDAELLEITGQSKRPPRETLQKLYLFKVDLPSWWLNDIRKAECQCPIPETPKWLGKTIIIPLNNGVWKGSINGENIRISYDPFVGVLREMAD